jgi:hypothetical protein
MKQADLTDNFTNASKSVSTSTPDPLSPTPSTFSAVKTPESTEEESDDPEPADDGDIPMEYASD